MGALLFVAAAPGFLGLMLDPKQHHSECSWRARGVTEILARHGPGRKPMPREPCARCSFPFRITQRHVSLFRWVRSTRRDDADDDDDNDTMGVWWKWWWEASIKPRQKKPRRPAGGY
jgi:hypothetical protein